METLSKVHKKAVQSLIFKMLTTCTGKALCDSGGEDGRNWQRNAKKTLKDFQNEKPVTVEEGYENTIGYTISLFHYLSNGLTLDAICKEYNAKKCLAWDSDLYGVSQKQYDYLMSYGFEIGRTFNSYNGETNLSQVIQGTWLTLNDRNYLLLQIHQGADVRGGYTDAKLFFCPDYENGALSEDVYGTVTRASGEVLQVSNTYDGVTITEDGENKKVFNMDGDKVELNLSEV